MTQEEFDRMPLVLRGWQVRKVLGLDWRGLKKLRRACPRLATQLPGEKEWRFFKCEVAKLARLKYR